jgi:formylglycine-generating enzyme required for sulfatase activity
MPFLPYRFLRIFLVGIVLFFFPAVHYAQEGKRDFAGNPVSTPRMGAIVVGLTEYEFPSRGEDQLRYADRDARQIAKLLKCIKNVELDTVITLINKDAKTSNFRNALNLLGQRATDPNSKKIDYLLIYFSGHGDTIPVTGEGFFKMYNSGHPEADLPGFQHRDLVIHLKDKFRTCARIIVIVDACRAGSFSGKHRILQEQYNFIAEEKRIVEILSCEKGEESMEIAGLEHGLFTYYLIKGAEEGSYDNRLSLAELEQYLLDNVRPELYLKKPGVSQTPMILGRGDFFTFDTCLNYARINPETMKEKFSESKHKSIPNLLPFEILFDSLLTAGNICMPLNASAYTVLKQVKSIKEYAGVYEDMRARYISAVLDEDVEIMHRYLNQDMNPWLTRFADMEKEIQMQKSMLEVLRPDDLLAKKTAARFFFFQAMEWYEYAKLVPGAERINRLKKADRLIARSLKIKPDSPTACFLQSQIYLGLNPGGKAKARPAQLAEVRKRAPGWRLPYLYARDRASLHRYAEMAAEYREYATRPTQQPPLPASLTTETGKPVTPEQIAQAFSGNLLLAEDLYLGHALEGKSPEKALKKHRKMAVSAYNLSMKASGISMPPAPDKSPVIGNLIKLNSVNEVADEQVAAEVIYEIKLDADTVVSEATKARWAELSRIESTPRDTASAKPAGESAGKNPESEKEKPESSGNKPAELPAKTESSADFFTDQLTGKFILVKGGTFNMGCTSEQQDCNDDEKPFHPVTLGDYYIAETEVTQAQWKAVMGENPSEFKGCDDCPVEQVSWNDAQEFITRLNARAGSPRYRLPTEAEWEYAARGGANSRVYQYAGSNDINEVAWYSGSSGSKTHPVKGKKPNELGVYDMTGNVWEWCSDRKGDYSAGSQTNPQGPSEGIFRVYRGGGWGYGAGRCRASYRGYNGPADRYDRLGFRLAASAPR